MFRLFAKCGGKLTDNSRSSRSDGWLPPGASCPSNTEKEMRNQSEMPADFKMFSAQLPKKRISSKGN